MAQNETRPPLDWGRVCIVVADRSRCRQRLVPPKWPSGKFAKLPASLPGWPRIRYLGPADLMAERLGCSQTAEIQRTENYSLGTLLDRICRSVIPRCFPPEKVGLSEAVSSTRRPIPSR